MELRLSVGGNPEHGWLVDIHDGVRNEVYRPENCKTSAHAAMAALVEHEGPDVAPKPAPVVPAVPAAPAKPVPASVVDAKA